MVTVKNIGRGFRLSRAYVSLEPTTDMLRKVRTVRENGAVLGEDSDTILVDMYRGIAEYVYSLRKNTYIKRRGQAYVFRHNRGFDTESYGHHLRLAYRASGQPWPYKPNLP